MGIKIVMAIALQRNAKPQVIGKSEYSHPTVWKVSKGKTVKISKMRKPVQKIIVVIIGIMDRFMPRSVAADTFISKFRA